MHLDEYQQAAIRTASEEQDDPERQLLIWSIAWAGEVGEFCEMAVQSMAGEGAHGEEQAERQSGDRQAIQEEKQLLMAAALLAGRIGSFLNKLKKRIGHGHAIDNQELADELVRSLQQMQTLARHLRLPEEDLVLTGKGEDVAPAAPVEDVGDHELKDELGDGLWYPAAIAWLRGWQLSEPARLNIEKLRRRYPDGFSQERSIHRRR